MKLKLIFYIMLNMLMFTLVINSGFAVNTCFNTSANITVCHNVDSGLFPQNIDLWEGENEKYGVYITNPDDDLNYNVFVKQIRNALDTGKIDVTKLGDETIFEFQNINDFYNLVQQKNAIGNVTLFTKAELNQETRERNILLTAQVLNWTIVLLVVVMELFKIIFSLISIILSLYMFFRLLPFALKQVIKLTFRILSGKETK